MTAILPAAVLLGGCASANYRPVQEVSFQQFTSGVCDNGGRQVAVSGQVSKAYQNTVVLSDAVDPQRTAAFTLKRPGAGSKVRGWFGTNRYELTQQRLNELSTQGTPVMIRAECQGKGVAAVAESISYDQDGRRVAIEY